MVNISEIVSKFKISPTQIVNLLGAVRTFDIVNANIYNPTDTVLGKLVSGDVNTAYLILRENAKNIFSGGALYSQFISLITKIGVTKMVIGLVEYIMGALTN